VQSWSPLQHEGRRLVDDEALRHALCVWWSTDAPRLAELPTRCNLNGVRAEFLDTFVAARRASTPHAKRNKKGSNDDWKNPHDPDAQITKMKDGRTHLAHKAEHAVDLETGAVLAVTLQPATAGDTNTLPETLAQCGEHIREVAVETRNEAGPGQLNPDGPAELVLDKGYHSSDVLVILKEAEVRSYCSEPDRGRRNWIGKEEEKAAVYQNRRRPKLAIQLTLRELFPAAVAPAFVPMRPDTSLDPMVEFVEERSDVSTLVIVTPSPQYRVELLDQIVGFQGHATPGKLADPILKALDRFLSGIHIQSPRFGTRDNLARWQAEAAFRA
jgi:hypothetical protein